VVTKLVDIIVDLEGNNLLPHIDTIWCATVKIVGRPEEDDASYRTIRTREDLLKVIDSGRVRRVINHNLLGFDLPVFQRVWGIPYSVSADGKNDSWNGQRVEFVDTLHLSMFSNPDRLGGHSLAAWGDRVGLQKGDHSDWSQFSEEMLQYNRLDTRVNERVYHALLREMEERLEKYGDEY
jgi:hypothetical protein